MAIRQTGLGRGLGALIKDSPVKPVAAAKAPEPAPVPESRDHVRDVALVRIHVNPFQPRHVFNPQALEDLVHSVRDHGILQALLVRRKGNDFELIAGERRLRAAREVGLKTVPVKVLDVTDTQALELALIENLQREDLNIIEEAEGYKALADQFGLTQQDIAERVGKGRATVTNALRILELTAVARQLLMEGALTAGHAKALLGLTIPAEQEALARRIVKDSLSVRAAEKIVAHMQMPDKKPRAKRQDIPEDHLRYLTDRLHQKFGTSVRLDPCKTLANGKKVKGRIEIDYYSPEELSRLLVLFGFTDEL